MDLEVLNHSGIPDSSFISVRAGGTRKQAQLSSLDRPFRFPSTPEECGTFKVEVLDLLGSARFAYDPNQTEYPIGLETAGNTSGMQVTFGLKKADVDSDYRPDSPDDDKVRDEKKEQVAREYLEKHGLTSFMQYLLQSLMKEKPDEPFAWLQKQVTKRMVREMSRNGALDDQGLEHFLPKEPTAVSMDQLAALEREAAAASEQMRQDNKKLREATAQLKAKYTKILGDSKLGAITEAPEDESAEDLRLQRTDNATPQVAAYREIASIQTDITSLAQENTALVAEMARMRASMEAVREEINAVEANTALVAEMA